MKSNNSFSLKARGHSFRYAYEGIISFFTTQHNAIIHFCFTVVAFTAALVFKISLNELIALVMVIGFVWFAEIFNTVVEAIMDHLSPQKHPAVKYIKDVSAAAVLVAAITAFIVGAIIFLPKIF
jgi:diacylglycerol kinase (ATP)